MSAGVGRPGLGIGLGVEGADHRVQFPHDHHPGTLFSALQSPLYPGEGQMILMRDVQTVQNVPDQTGGALLFKAQLRVGEDILPDGDDLFFVLVDGGKAPAFQIFPCHNTYPFSALEIS